MHQLEHDILTFLEKFLTMHFGAKYDYTASNYDGIDVIATNKTDENDRTLIIRVTINHDHQQVYIPNIFIPFDLRYNGLGKLLISKIYTISTFHSYDVFVVQLTDSFRERLLARGADTTDQFDTLHITEKTDLGGASQ